MEFYGKNKEIALKSGVVLYATKRLIDSVWTAAFAVIGEGKVYLISYDRENPIGYEKGRELLKCVLKEDSSRSLVEILLGEDMNSFGDNPRDAFEIVNPRYIFSYDGPREDELRKFPELKWLLVKSASKKFGLSENKFMNFDEFSITENLRYSGKDVARMPIIGKIVTKPIAEIPSTEYDIVEIIKGRNDENIYVANFWYKPGVPQIIHSDFVDKWIPSELEEKRGLWDNVWAKRRRGEKPAKPGDEDYPDAKAWKAAQKKKK